MDSNSHTTSHSYPLIEIVHSHTQTIENIDRRLGQADFARAGLQAIMGGRAFREYNALSNKVGLNPVGNFRGMVVSARWRALFRQTSTVGEYMENLGYLTALASGVAESGPKLESILASNGSVSYKGLQIAALAGTISQRSLAGAVPAGVHLIYRSLEGWCMLAGLAGGKAASGASQCVQVLTSADTLVQTTFQTVTDTSNQSKAVWSVIDFILSPRKSAP
jgi:hypothetical protein